MGLADSGAAVVASTKQGKSADSSSVLRAVEDGQWDHIRYKIIQT